MEEKNIPKILKLVSEDLEERSTPFLGLFIVISEFLEYEYKSEQVSDRKFQFSRKDENGTEYVLTLWFDESIPNIFPIPKISNRLKYSKFEIFRNH